MPKWAFSLFAPFHRSNTFQTNLEMYPYWKHTWTSCLINNLLVYQVAVTNVSHLRKIALIVEESFTSSWEVICWLLFLQNVKDGFSIPEVRVSGRHRAVDDVCHTKVQAKGALMNWKGDHWKRSEGQWIICKRDASRWSQTRTLRTRLLIFSSAHDYLQLWAYHGRKVKAMLDNGTITGIALEPLRLQKGFLTKAIMHHACVEALSCHNTVSIALKVKC